MTAVHARRKPRAVVAMSGGVDSSVTAALLLEQGWDVVGVTMQLWDHGDAPVERAGTCCSLDDVQDARRVAEQLEIPFYVANFQEQFQAAVVDDLVDEYLAGRTPNPCVRCNDVMKFRLLLRRARALGGEILATGHYARIERDEARGEWTLRRGLDPDKDQSYFVYCMDQEQLASVRFPVGGLTKDEVRDHARRFDLATAEKGESQDVCFIAGESYRGFVARHASDRLPGEGTLVALDGTSLGRHRGHHHFTVGQRKGLGVAAPDPQYVVRVDAERNQVVVGGADDLCASGLMARAFRWIGAAPPPGTPLDIKIRYRTPPAPGRLIADDAGHAELRFDAPARAITPGQTVVVYAGDRVLGGGLIEGSVP